MVALGAVSVPYDGEIDELGRTIEDLGHGRSCCRGGGRRRAVRPQTGRSLLTALDHPLRRRRSELLGEVAGAAKGGVAGAEFLASHVAKGQAVARTVLTDERPQFGHGEDGSARQV